MQGEARRQGRGARRHAQLLQGDNSPGGGLGHPQGQARSRRPGRRDLLQARPVAAHRRRRPARHRRPHTHQLPLHQDQQDRRLGRAPTRARLRQDDQSPAQSGLHGRAHAHGAAEQHAGRPAASASGLLQGEGARRRDLGQGALRDQRRAAHDR